MNDLLMQRLRAANPAANEQRADSELFASIVATHGDARLSSHARSRRGHSRRYALGVYVAEEASTRPLRALRGQLRARSRTLVALLTVLVAAGGAAAAVSLTGGRSAPVRTPAGGVLCPAGYEYLAYARLGLFFPRNYPAALPRSVRGTSCYSSAQDATAAGYRLAATPAGDVLLDGLYFAPASTVVRSVCRSAERFMKATVYCPALLPAPWTDPPALGANPDCPSAGCSLHVLSISGGFTAPGSYVGAFSGVGEVNILEVPSTQARWYPYLLGCSAVGRSRQQTVVDGHRGAWYACNAQAVLEWHIGSTRYGISATGPPDQRQNVVRYIANHLSREAPAR